MKVSKKLTVLGALSLVIGNVHANENDSTRAVADANFDWGSFTVTTAAPVGSSEPAPTIQWQYQHTYINSNSQTNTVHDWSTSLEIAENGISSWSKANPASLQSYAKDTNTSADSRSWSSSYRIAGFTVQGNGTVTFSAKYTLTSSLSPGSVLPSYADSAALLTVTQLDDTVVGRQIESVDLNNSNANANNNSVTKTNNMVLSIPVKNGQQYKFYADIHAKASLSNAGSTGSKAEEALVLGSWCTNVGQDCDGAFRVNLSTGKRTLISAYTKADQEKLFDDPDAQSTVNRGGKWWEKAAISSTGDVYVFADNRFDIKTGNNIKGIYRISPIDGSRQLVKDVNNAGSVASVNVVPDKFLISSSNRLLLGTPGKVTTIDLSTGQSSLLSDAANTSQGPVFSRLMDFDANGDLFALDTSGLIQVDNLSGMRTPFANYGLDPDVSALIDANGSIFSASNSQLLKYKNTGAAILISDLGNQAQGHVIMHTQAFNQTRDGRLFVLDSGNGQFPGALVAIDKETGTRTLVSNFQDQNQGPIIYDARAMAVGNMPDYNGADPFAGAAGNQPVLNQTASVNQPQKGQTFSYVVTFSNYEASNATNVILTNKLPKKTVFVSAVPGQGKCTGKVTVICKFGVVEPGNRVTAKINVTRVDAGQIENVAKVTYKMKKTGTKKKKTYRLDSKKSITVS